MLIGVAGMVGTGKTTLSGNSDYSGPTNISNGTLAVTGSFINSNITVDRGANASATLDGSTLKITGNFSKFTSPATGGSVRIGLAKGVPGDAIGTLTVDHATSGHFSGSVKLNSSQAAALSKQAIYVRIDSEKAPDGNVQGWLEGTR